MQDPRLLSLFLRQFKIQKDQVFGFENLWAILLEVIRRSGRPVIIVIDAIDECEQTSLTFLLANFRGMFSGSTAIKNLRLLILSREHPDCIGRSLQHYPRIRLDSDNNNDAKESIDRYISASVCKLGLDSTLSHRVESLLLSRANGTYLWVSFAIGELEGKPPTEIEGCLKEIPTGLDEMYQRMLGQVPHARRDTVFELLLWATFAVRPLSVSELVEAIGIEAAGKLPADQTIRDSARDCGHLLVLDAKDVIHLVHQSAKEFLSQTLSGAPPSDLTLERTHLKLADTCLSYLLAWLLTGGTSRIQTDTENVRKEFPFLQYAVNHWQSHARKCGSSWQDLIKHNPAFLRSRPSYESLCRD